MQAQLELANASGATMADSHGVKTIQFNASGFTQIADFTAPPKTLSPTHYEVAPSSNCSPLRHNNTSTSKKSAKKSVADSPSKHTYVKVSYDDHIEPPAMRQTTYTQPQQEIRAQTYTTPVYARPDSPNKWRNAELEQKTNAIQREFDQLLKTKVVHPGGR